MTSLCIALANNNTKTVAPRVARINGIFVNILQSHQFHSVRSVHISGMWLKEFAEFFNAIPC